MGVERERKEVLVLASEKKLDCVILGLLAHEALSGYEIKKRMDTTLHFFWNASYGSIYPTLHGLTKDGFVKVQNDPLSNRKRQVYSITEAGQKHLAHWLQVPVEKDELRYETLLKLFFGNEIGAKQTLAHIEAFETNIKQELPYLLSAKSILEQHLEDSTHRYYLLTVSFGIQTYEAYLAWCVEAKQLLEKE